MFGGTKHNYMNARQNLGYLLALIPGGSANHFALERCRWLLTCKGSDRDKDPGSAPKVAGRTRKGEDG